MKYQLFAGARGSSGRGPFIYIIKIVLARPLREYCVLKVVNLTWNFLDIPMKIDYISSFLFCALVFHFCETTDLARILIRISVEIFALVLQSSLYPSNLNLSHLSIKWKILLSICCRHPCSVW